MELKSRLQDLMVKYRFRPDKKLGQHFCINKNLLQKMVEEASLNKNDVVIEIGPGTGFLTELMIKKCRVIGIEKDKNLSNLLENEFKNEKNFELIKNDYLREEKKGNKIISLPPYNISDDIMVKVFEQQPDLCVFVFQKEFVEKLVAEPGFPEYCYLSVMTSILFKIKTPIRSISPNNFYPAPAAYSSLISLKKKEEIKVDTKELCTFLKQVFRFKNKTLENAFHYVKMNYDKKELEKTKLVKQKINLIEPASYLEIFKKISPK
ncbi:MAG: 16S rRNA (adenine(1518)-N(6)/adenine(1519)-N(6))-dimethyltransferase RsmA [Candidatus Diapherotrites archaeon]